MFSHNPTPAASRPDRRPTYLAPLQTSWAERSNSFDSGCCVTPTEPFLKVPVVRSNSIDSGVFLLSPIASLFDELPEELLLQIVQNVAGSYDNFGERDFRTLYNLCLTNRQLCRLATPLLYEVYHSNHNQYAYLRTLRSDSWFAKQVKTMSWETGTSASGPCDIEIEESDSHYALESGLAIRGEWQRSPGETEDAYFTAALTYADNVEHVKLVDKHAGDKIRESRRWLKTLCARSPHSFQNLKALEITMHSMQLSDLAEVLQVPSIRSLKVCELVQYQPPSRSSAGPEMALPAGMSNVEELTLQQCQLGSDEIVALIAACKSLKSFRYHLSDAKSAWHPVAPPDAVLSFATIKEALDQHASTLEVVELQTSTWGLWDGASIEGKIDSFAAYQKLETLALPTCALPAKRDAWLQNYLPSSLQSLRLEDAQDDRGGPEAMEALPALAKHARANFANFNNISLSPDVAGFLSREDFDRAVTQLASEGIHLQIVGWKAEQFETLEKLYTEGAPLEEY